MTKAEEKSKEEIVAQYDNTHVSLLTRAYLAMDEYAKQEAIGFDNWKIEKEWYSLNIDGQKMWERGGVAGSYERKSPDELYDLYLKSKT